MKRKNSKELREKTYKTERSRKQRKQIEEEGPIPSAHLTLSITFHTQYSKTITLGRGDAALVFHPSHPKRDRIRHVLPCACIPQTRFCGPVSVRPQLSPNFTQKCRPHQTQQATNKVAAEAGEAAEPEVPINGATRKRIRMRIPRHRYRTSRHRHCSHLERREAQRMRRPSTLPN